MSELLCEYHPNIAAVDKCERCHRLICLQDKTSHSTQSSGSQYHSYTKVILCPLCNLDAVGEARNMLKKGSTGMFLFLAISSLISLIFLLSTGFVDATGPGILLVPLGFFGLGFLMFRRVFAISEQQTNKMEERATVGKQKFLNTIKDPSIRSKYETSKLTCLDCAYELSRGDLFCPNCGDSTLEERSLWN